jgi:hypothetical protein
VERELHSWLEQVSTLSYHIWIMTDLVKEILLDMKEFAFELTIMIHGTVKINLQSLNAKIMADIPFRHLGSHPVMVEDAAAYPVMRRKRPISTTKPEKLCF